MSRILDKLQAQATGMRDLARNEKTSVASTIYQTRVDTAHPMIYEYCLQLKINTMFRCNQAEYACAMQDARTMLARELYKDVYVAIARLRSVAWSGDTHAIMEELDILEEALK